ncbi:hypothetical protein [Arthrobacter glacialis]|uniref:hypothetical protein n=1 Tax=Arthrobacter glacialis TaxID=1664 RepID=UPI001A9DCBDD|nr:hypothetical protein [Arthrobacter glacialis]
MATLSKNGHSVTTELAREIVSLRAQGYTEATAPKRDTVESKSVEHVKAVEAKPSK